MKKTLTLLTLLFTLAAGFVFAQSETDPFDSLAEKLLSDINKEDSTVAVKLFNADLSANEKKKISKSVQFALFCTNKIEIVSKIEEADYICTGNIETDGPNYIVSAKITDNYDGSVISKAHQKVPKNYYQTEAEVQTAQTVTVEQDDDTDDLLGAVILGTLIGGTFHILTSPPPARPRHEPRLKPAPRPAPRPGRK